MEMEVSIKTNMRHNEQVPCYQRGDGSTSRREAVSVPSLVRVAVEVLDELLRALGSARGREVARTRLVTATVPTIRTTTLSALTTAMVILGKVRVALLLEARHEAMALADFVRSTAALEVLATSVATFVGVRGLRSLHAAI